MECANQLTLRQIERLVAIKGWANKTDEQLLKDKEQRQLAKLRKQITSERSRGDYMGAFRNLGDTIPLAGK